jgi:hypothetical protein
MKVILSKIIIISLFILVTGCGKSNEKKPDVLKDDKKTEEAGGLKLPVDFPVEFTSPPGSRLLSVSISNDGTDVMFQSDGIPDKLIADYKKSAADAGYEEQSADKNNNQSNGTILIFSRIKDKKYVTINITRSKNKDKLTISVFYKTN